MTQSWFRSYFPAFFFFLLGLFFMAVPSLAVFAVVGGFFFLGTIYAIAVYKIRSTIRTHGGHHHSQSSTRNTSRDDIIDAEFRTVNEEEPTFRNVSIRIFRGFH